MAAIGWRREVGVGIFVVAALAVGAIGILAISRESRLFSPKIEYRTAFTNITGLTVGSPVRLAGVQVGTVRRIEFPEELERSDILVVLSVDRAVRHRIRTDSRALLRALSYVSIEKYIEITTGGPGSEPLGEDGFIPPDVTEFERLQLAGQDIAGNMQEITASLKALLEAVTEGEGLVSELFFDDQFGRETRDNLREITGSLRRITVQLEAQEGLIGRLLLDPEFGRRQAEAIEAATGRLNRLLDSLQSGEGAIGDLLSEDGTAKAAIEDFAAVAANLREASAGFRESQGLIGRMLNDEEYGRQLLDRIETIAANLESISAKLDRGEGTLGLMLNDPDVYIGIEDLVGGIRESRVLSALIKKYGKKGARERIEKALEEIERQERQEQEGDRP